MKRVNFQSIFYLFDKVYVNSSTIRDIITDINHKDIEIKSIKEKSNFLENENKNL